MDENDNSNAVGRVCPMGGEQCYCLHPGLLSEGVVNGCGPIHHFFNLSYASYLVLPRSMLQSMPKDWQAKFVMMLEEIRDMFGDYPEDGTYKVRLRDEQGRCMVDPLADYERGRRIIPGKSV